VGAEKLGREKVGERSDEGVYCNAASAEARRVRSHGVESLRQLI
jgi:hypothetical protein